MSQLERSNSNIRIILYIKQIQLELHHVNIEGSSWIDEIKIDESMELKTGWEKHCIMQKVNVMFV